MEKSIIILFLGVLIGWFGNNLLHVPVPQITEEAIATTVAEKEYRNVWWVSDADAVKIAFENHQAETGTKVKGLSVWNDNDCTIYAYEPDNVTDYGKMETLGHELLHCFKGSYHE